MNVTRIVFVNTVLASSMLLGATPAVTAAEEPVTVVARFWVTPGREAEAEPRFRRALEFMQGIEPDSSFKLYRSRKDPSLFVYIEVFPSGAALEEHLKTVVPARSKDLGPTPTGLLARPPEIEEYQAIGK